MSSIRAQVLAWVLGFLVLALLVMLYFSYQKALHEIEEIFDAELVQTAKLIGKLVVSDIDSKGAITTSIIADDSDKHKYEKHVSYQVWYRGALVLKSAHAPERPLGTSKGFHEVKIGDKQWWAYGLYLGAGKYHIYTAEDMVARKELSWYFASKSLGVMFWAIPLFALIIAITVDRGLRPLQRISAEVSNRDIHQLTPVADNNTPKELIPLVNALNALLQRLDAAISRERRFAADASHELRTPLSAIRLHSQLAMRASSAEQQCQSLEKVLQAVDQSTHLVEQLLMMARMSPESERLDFEAVELADLCMTLKEKLAEFAAEKGIKIDVEYSPAGLASINSNPHLLHTIVRNLLDNAIRYAYQDSRIECNIIQDADETTISIKDEGPGIPEDQMEQVRERFVRLAGQDIQGCGLGLSIVSQAVERFGGRLILRNRTDGCSGLIAEVKLRSSP